MIYLIKKIPCIIFGYKRINDLRLLYNYNDKQYKIGIKKKWRYWGIVHQKRKLLYDEEKASNNSGSV